MRRVATTLQERTTPPQNTRCSIDQGNHVQEFPPSWLHDHWSLDTVSLFIECDVSEIRPDLSKWRKGKPGSPAHPLCIDAAGEEVRATYLSRKDKENSIHWRISPPLLGRGLTRRILLNFSLAKMIHGVNYGMVTHEDVVAVTARLNRELVALGISSVRIEDFKFCRCDVNLNLILDRPSSLIFKVFDYCKIPYMSHHRSFKENEILTGGFTNNKSRCLACYSKVRQLLAHRFAYERNVGKRLEELLDARDILRIEVRALKALQCQNRLKLDRFGDLLTNFHEVLDHFDKNLESLRSELRKYQKAARSVKLKVPRHATDQTQKSLKRWQSSNKALGLSWQTIISALRADGLNTVKTLLAKHSLSDSNITDFIKRLQVAVSKDLTVSNPETSLVIADLLDKLEMRDLRLTQHDLDNSPETPEPIPRCDDYHGHAIDTQKTRVRKSALCLVMPAEAIHDDRLKPKECEELLQSNPLSGLAIVKGEHPFSQLFDLSNFTPNQSDQRHNLRARLSSAYETSHHVQLRLANRKTFDSCSEEWRRFFCRGKWIPRWRCLASAIELARPPDECQLSREASSVLRWGAMAIAEFPN